MYTTWITFFPCEERENSTKDLLGLKPREAAREALQVSKPTKEAPRDSNGRTGQSNAFFLCFLNQKSFDHVLVERGYHCLEQQ